jgi:membrane-bound acyltransferase YfiQ involved in biofilm formation
MGLYRLKPGLLSHLVIALAWLGFLAVANRQASQPVTSIFPYLAPVVFFAWVYNARCGFFFAGVATLAALPGDYVETHTSVELLHAGFLTYAQLTGAVIGCVLAKIIRERSGRS